MTNIKGTDNRANEITIATVKKLPFPIHDREFVGKLTWTKSTPDTYSVVWDGINDKVDYGGSLRTTTREFIDRLTML